jgi:hypothetical protein
VKNESERRFRAERAQPSGMCSSLRPIVPIVAESSPSPPSDHPQHERHERNDGDRSSLLLVERLGPFFFPAGQCTTSFVYGAAGTWHRSPRKRDDVARFPWPLSYFTQHTKLTIHSRSFRSDREERKRTALSNGKSAAAGYVLFTMSVGSDRRLCSHLRWLRSVLSLLHLNLSQRGRGQLLR